MATKTKKKEPQPLPATLRKRRRRAKPEGRAYDRARNRALTRLGQNHPDEYQDLLSEEFKVEMNRLS